jgi:glucose/arabinose dehydrogenase
MTEGRLVLADILDIDLKTGRARVFAKGMRNLNGLGWELQTEQLWTVVNERDELGRDLDYFSSIKEGAFLGLAVEVLGANMSMIECSLKP